MNIVEITQHGAHDFDFKVNTHKNIWKNSRLLTKAHKWIVSKDKSILSH